MANPKKDNRTVNCCGKKEYPRRKVVKWSLFLGFGVPLAVFAAMLVTALIRVALVEELYVRRELFPGQEPAFMDVSEDEILAMAENFAGGIQIPTISYEEGNFEGESLVEINEYIEETYPILHSDSHVAWEIVHNYSRLYRIGGTSGSSKAFLLCAHLDVVPPGEVDEWEMEPFGTGSVMTDDGGKKWVYGRGAIDDKHSVFGILEALEYMARKGERPERTVYVAFGHDEEIGGNEGAANLSKRLAEMLEANEETIEFLLDEGSFVLKDVIPGVSDPVIYISVTEKGAVDVELTARGVQAHSSYPPEESAVGILSRSVADLEKKKQPSRFGTGIETDTIRYSAAHTSFLYKIGMANLWLFGWLVELIMAADPTTDAAQRTTTAPTILSAGVKTNIVPMEAFANINHRIHPSDTLDDVLEHDRGVIDDDRVEINTANYMDPLPVSPYDNGDASFQIIAVSALEVYPDAVVVPGLMIANTDTKHYAPLAARMYRFAPNFLLSDELDMFHGIDEKISVETFGKVVQFFYRIIKNSAYDQ